MIKYSFLDWQYSTFYYIWITIVFIYKNKKMGRYMPLARSNLDGKCGGRSHRWEKKRIYPAEIIGAFSINKISESNQASKITTASEQRYQVNPNDCTAIENPDPKDDFFLK